MDRDFLEEILVVINACKRAFEGELRKSYSGSPNAYNAWKHAILSIEEIKVDFNAHRLDTDRQVSAVRDMKVSLLNLTSSNEFSNLSELLTIRPVAPRRLMAELGMIYPAGIRVSDAVKILIHRIDEHIGAELPLDNPNIALALRAIVPDQKIAPAKFIVSGGKIHILREKNFPDEGDLDNVNRAKQHLEKTGVDVILALKSSNCDRRLLGSLEDLHSGIVGDANVIQIGLMNIGCDAMSELARNELPDALQGMLAGYSAAVSMYVAQFSDWQRFSENAAAVRLSPQDVSQIGNAALQVAWELESRPDIADPEVPATIRALRAFIANPVQATTRAAFAMLRTLENLVASAFQYGAELIDQTAKKSISGLSTAASRAIVIGLMTVALAGAGNLSGISDKVAETSWMRSAVNIVRSQLEKMDGE